MTRHYGAPAPGANGSAMLSCGLLTIPVRIATGLDSQSDVKRSSFTKDGHPVGSKNYDKETGADVESADIVYKVRASNKVWIELSDEKKEELIGGPGDTKLAEVVAFVPYAAMLREYAPTKWDQVRPDQRAEKAFALLVEAMRRLDRIALVKLDRRWYAMTAEGWWIRLAPARTVREPQPMPVAPPAGKELDLAESLVEALTQFDPPVLDDEVAPRLHEYVEAQAAGMELEAVPDAPKIAPVADIMAALEGSLARIAQERKAS